MTTNARQIPFIEPEHAPVLARPYLEDGGSPLAAVLAHVPELLEATLPFVATILGPSHLGERLKHIVVLRTSVVNACRYCTRVYSESANEAGLCAQDVTALRGSEPQLRDFTEREATAIVFASAFCHEPATSVAPLKSHFRDDEIVALATIAGATLFLNRFASAMGLA